MATPPSKDMTLAKAIERLATVHEKQLGAIATEIGNVALQLKHLGNGDAATPLGAIENLAKELKDAANAIAAALQQEN